MLAWLTSKALLSFSKAEDKFMPQIPDYDLCYRLLELLPGASPDEIEDNFKLLAFTWHPDRFVGTKFEKKATRRLQDINNARDVLTNYWRTYQVAPPTASCPAGSGDLQNNSAGAAFRQREAASKQAAAAGFERAAPGSWQFGPPAFKKNFVHRIFDFLDELERSGNSGAAAGAMLLMPIGAIVVISALLKLTCRAAGLPESILFSSQGGAIVTFVLFAIAGYLIFAGSDAWYKAYRIEESPYLEFSPQGLSADYLSRRITDALKDFSRGQDHWEIAAPKKSSGGFTEITATIHSEERLWRLFPAGYQISFTARIQERQTTTPCLVAFWFHSGGSLWKAPLVAVLSQTDASVRKKLGKLS